MTTKKYVSELNEKELTNVFIKNNKLQLEILDDMIESEMYWISEHLDCIKASLSDWSIGANSHNYLDVKNNESFINGVIEMQKDYGALGDKEDDFINEVAEKLELLNDTEMYSDEFDVLENEIENDVKTLAEKIVTNYKNVFDSLYEEKNQLDYFIEFYAESRLDEETYINVDQNDFILYADVTQNYAN